MKKKELLLGSGALLLVRKRIEESKGRLRRRTKGKIIRNRNYRVRSKMN